MAEEEKQMLIEANVPVYPKIAYNPKDLRAYSRGSGRFGAAMQQYTENQGILGKDVVAGNTDAVWSNFAQTPVKFAEGIFAVSEYKQASRKNFLANKRITLQTVNAYNQGAIAGKFQQYFKNGKLAYKQPVSQVEMAERRMERVNNGYYQMINNAQQATAVVSLSANIIQYLINTIPETLVGSFTYIAAPSGTFHILDKGDGSVQSCKATAKIVNRIAQSTRDAGRLKEILICLYGLRAMAGFNQMITNAKSLSKVYRTDPTALSQQRNRNMIAGMRNRILDGIQRGIVNPNQTLEEMLPALNQSTLARRLDGIERAKQAIQLAYATNISNQSARLNNAFTTVKVYSQRDPFVAVYPQQELISGQYFNYQAPKGSQRYKRVNIPQQQAQMMVENLQQENLVQPQQVQDNPLNFEQQLLQNEELKEPGDVKGRIKNKSKVPGASTRQSTRIALNQLKAETIPKQQQQGGFIGGVKRLFGRK